jgi:BMFP domain-containing protein YqiC
VAEVADSLVDREEFAVVRGVLLLRRREFTGEVSERLLSVVNALLQHRT